MTTYRIEFGPAWPVPPITVDFTDRNAAARLTPTDLDPDICGDQNDDEVCDLDPGHDGDHCANVAVGWANRFARPAAGTSVTNSGAAS
jgi:hypothetical protein